MPLYKLENVIQNYAWGSKNSIHELFGIKNVHNQPQAEIWMGAHPNGCSRVAESGQLLSEVIASNPETVLGQYTSARFGELPYLFKVLAAETPLSIQVHPNKHKSEIGYARENQQGVALNASHRNYKDPNHKPELVYALTFYKAMNGFRPISDILSLFRQANIPTLEEEVVALERNQTSQGLQVFFTAIMLLEGQRKAAVLYELYGAYQRSPKTVMYREALTYSQEFWQHYRDDLGLLSPLMLNIIELAPGEAMFLHASTPHAYIQGTGLEIMANSDNVLRAGLTPKFVDVPELIENTLFEPIPIQDIKLEPVLKENRLFFPVPVDDFGFDVLPVTEEPRRQYVRGAEIVFCIEGMVQLKAESQNVHLRAGESVFITANSGHFDYFGYGKLARAYN